MSASSPAAEGAAPPQGGVSRAVEGGGSGGDAYGSMSPEFDPEVQNALLSDYLYIILASVSIALMAWRLTSLLVRYVRLVSCLNTGTQRFFARPDGRLASFKKDVLYAPLFRKRHNREFQLSSAINVGTLPSRFQFAFLLGYFATNVIFCVIYIDFSGAYVKTAGILRNRTGNLAVVNMIPLFVMAGRNNPLIKILGVSFDTFNLLHRWVGRIVILESVAHTLAYLIPKAQAKGWSVTMHATYASPFLLWGFVATIAFVIIGIQASSISRHAFYETFKLMHILLAGLALAGVWYHCNSEKMPQLKYVWATFAVWCFDRTARTIRLINVNIGSDGATALVEALPGNACRVTVTMARPWTFKPGQHAYLYIPSISFWQSHPFSVAWSEETETYDSEKLPFGRSDVQSTRKTTMSYVIRARTGFTASLFNKAAAESSGKLLTKCYVEGPYGGVQSMQSYGSVMLFAGGVGVTHAVPYIRDLLVGYTNGAVATRKIVLVWIIQSPEHLEWIRPWMTEILAMRNRRDVLRIMLFVSRPRSTKEIHSPSSTVQMFPGRPNVDTLIGIEMENQIGALGVSVCGPGSLSDEVRKAVRSRLHQGSITFMDEAFSW